MDITGGYKKVDMGVTDDGRGLPRTPLNINQNADDEDLLTGPDINLVENSPYLNPQRISLSDSPVPFVKLDISPSLHGVDPFASGEKIPESVRLSNSITDIYKDTRLSSQMEDVQSSSHQTSVSARNDLLSRFKSLKLRSQTTLSSPKSVLTPDDPTDSGM